MSSTSPFISVRVLGCTSSSCPMSECSSEATVTGWKHQPISKTNASKTDLHFILNIQTLALPGCCWLLSIAASSEVDYWSNIRVIAEWGPNFTQSYASQTSLTLSNCNIPAGFWKFSGFLSSTFTGFAVEEKVLLMFSPGNSVTMGKSILHQCNDFSRETLKSLKWKKNVIAVKRVSFRQRRWSFQTTSKPSHDPTGGPAKSKERFRPAGRISRCRAETKSRWSLQKLLCIYCAWLFQGV